MDQGRPLPQSLSARPNYYTHYFLSTHGALSCKMSFSQASSNAQSLSCLFYAHHNDSTLHRHILCSKNFNVTKCEPQNMWGNDSDAIFTITEADWHCWCTFYYLVPNNQKCNIRYSRKMWQDHCTFRLQVYAWINKKNSLCTSCLCYINVAFIPFLKGPRVL